MIYIKEDNTRFKYHLSDDNKLICTAADRSEYVILYDISGEFDGIITPDKKTHIVLQSLNGELLYLKKEDEIWKKFSIMKTRKGVQKISNIRLAASQDKLCAFYIINHQGKNLLVKHIFSAGNNFIEPEVIGIIGGRCDYSLLDTQSGQTILIYKNADGVYTKILFDKGFAIAESEKIELEQGVVSLCAVGDSEEIYFAYAVQRKNSVALGFCCKSQPDNIKIVTFGITKNSSPQIFLKDDALIIQWEENGIIMQSESYDGGKSFSKPKHLTKECHFAKVRQIQNSKDFVCNICAVYNMEPFIYPYKQHKVINQKGANPSMSRGMYKSSEYNADITNEQLLQKLNELHKNVDRIEKSLISACTFLDELKNFKAESENLSFSGFATPTNTKLTGDDIGEINEDNLKLFENTDIESVLPDKTAGGEDTL